MRLQEPALIYVRCHDFVWPVTVFPAQMLYHAPRALVESVAPSLSAQGSKILLDLLLSVPAGTRMLELPYTFRPRATGESKLDARVLLDFAGLLLDKILGWAVPLRRSIRPSKK